MLEVHSQNSCPFLLALMPALAFLHGPWSYKQPRNNLSCYSNKNMRTSSMLDSDTRTYLDQLPQSLS